MSCAAGHWEFRHRPGLPPPLHRKWVSDLQDTQVLNDLTYCTCSPNGRTSSIHLWHGLSSPSDVIVQASYLAHELQEAVGGSPVIYREVGSAVIA